MTEKSDVIVIGGGVIGLCSAYFLQKSGATVTVVERGEIGGECSWGNAGLIVPSHVIPLATPGIIAKGLKWMFDSESPFYIKPRMNLQFLSWLWQFRKACSLARIEKSIPVLHGLLQASHDIYKNFTANGELDFSLEEKGLLMLCKTEKGFDEERKAAEAGRALGMKITDMSRDELLAMDPALQTSAPFGVYYHQDMHFNPDHFTQALKKHLETKDVRFLTHAEATGFIRRGEKLLGLLTTKGTLQGEQFVLACGSWSPQVADFLKLRLPVEAGKGYSVTTAAPKNFSKIPSMLSEAKVAITPLGEKIRYAGTMELAGLDLHVNQRRVNAILKAVADYFPNLELSAAFQEKPWSGLRPCTPDGLPIIGRANQFENLTIATGHAMLGVSLAPITGQLVGQIVAEQTASLDLSPLRVDRF